MEGDEDEALVCRPRKDCLNCCLTQRATADRGILRIELACRSHRGGRNGGSGEVRGLEGRLDVVLRVNKSF